MTPAEFKTKWAKFAGKESAAYQDHFSDLCRMLGVQTPIEADPTGNEPRPRRRGSQSRKGEKAEGATRQSGRRFDLVPRRKCAVQGH
jgi:hypothetical protein